MRAVVEVVELCGGTALTPTANADTTHDQYTPQTQTEPLGRSRRGPEPL